MPVWDCEAPLATGGDCATASCDRVEVVWSRCWPGEAGRVSGRGLAVDQSFIAFDGQVTDPTPSPVDLHEGGFGRVYQDIYAGYATYSYDGEGLGCYALPSMSECGVAIANPELDLVLWHDTGGSVGGECSYELRAGLATPGSPIAIENRLAFDVFTPLYELREAYAWTVSSQAITLTVKPASSAPEAPAVHQAFRPTDGSLLYQRIDVAAVAVASHAAVSLVLTDAGELRRLEAEQAGPLAFDVQPDGIALSPDGRIALAANPAASAMHELQWFDEQGAVDQQAVAVGQDLLDVAVCDSGDVLLVGSDALALVSDGGAEWTSPNPGMDAVACAQDASFLVHGAGVAMRVDLRR